LRVAQIEAEQHAARDRLWQLPKPIAAVWRNVCLREIGLPNRAPVRNCAAHALRGQLPIGYLDNSDGAPAVRASRRKFTSMPVQPKTREFGMRQFELNTKADHIAQLEVDHSVSMSSENDSKAANNCAHM
jgi:hypothetical protein